MEALLLIVLAIIAPFIALCLLYVPVWLALIVFKFLEETFGKPPEK